MSEIYRGMNLQFRKSIIGDRPAGIGYRQLRSQSEVRSGSPSLLCRILLDDHTRPGFNDLGSLDVICLFPKLDMGFVNKLRRKIDQWCGSP